MSSLAAQTAPLRAQPKGIDSGVSGMLLIVLSLDVPHLGPHVLIVRVNEAQRLQFGLNNKFHKFSFVL